MRAPNPSDCVHFCLYKFSRTGIKNANVFPLPVLAAPKISLPFSARGKAFDWMSVRVLKCDASSPRAVASDKGRSEKSLISALGSWMGVVRILCSAREGFTYKLVDCFLQSSMIVDIAFPFERPRIIFCSPRWFWRSPGIWGRHDYLSWSWISHG